MQAQAGSSTSAQPAVPPVVETKTYPAARLHQFIMDVFMHFGVPRDDAIIAADVLITADLRGIDRYTVS